MYSAPSVFSAAARVLFYVALSFTGGLPCFYLWSVRPVLRQCDGQVLQVERFFLRLAWSGVAIMPVAALTHLFANQHRSAHWWQGNTRDDLVGICILLVAGGLVWSVSRENPWAIAAWSVGLVTAVGHISLDKWPTLAGLFFDGSRALHVFGTIVWLGGLFGFFLVMLLRWRYQRVGTATAFVIGRRFSLQTIVTLSVMILTGAYLYENKIGGWTSFIDGTLIRTPIGLTMLIKLGLTVIVMGLGGLNYLHLLRVSDHFIRRMMLSSALEIALIFGILACVPYLEGDGRSQLFRYMNDLDPGHQDLPIRLDWGLIAWGLGWVAVLVAFNVIAIWNAERGPRSSGGRGVSHGGRGMARRRRL